jgi:hypothetical protein
MATRQSGEITNRFSVNCPINPSKKHPLRFTSNVPYGKVPGTRICTSPCSPYRASVPIAPKTAIRVIRNYSPFLSASAPNKKLLAPRGSQESSEPATHAGPVMANSIAFMSRARVYVTPSEDSRVR